MHGGVGGAEPQGSPLSRSLDQTSNPEWASYYRFECVCRQNNWLEAVSMDYPLLRTGHKRAAAFDRTAAGAAAATAAEALRLVFR